MAKIDGSDDRRRVGKQRHSEEGGKSIGPKKREVKRKSISKGGADRREEVSKEPDRDRFDKRDFPGKKPVKRDPDRKRPSLAGGRSPKRAARTPGKEGKMDAPWKGESKSRARQPGQTTPVSCTGCGGSVLLVALAVAGSVAWLSGVLG